MVKHTKVLWTMPLTPEISLLYSHHSYLPRFTTILLRPGSRWSRCVCCKQPPPTPRRREGTLVWSGWLYPYYNMEWESVDTHDGRWSRIEQKPVTFLHLAQIIWIGPRTGRVSLSRLDPLSESFWFLIWLGGKVKGGFMGMHTARKVTQVHKHAISLSRAKHKQRKLHVLWSV